VVPPPPDASVRGSTYYTNVRSIITSPPVASSSPARAKPLEQLEREICELAAHLAAATCTWLLLVAEFDERRGWGEWGVKSCAHWLSWRCSIGLATAREHVRVARRLGELPRVRDAFGKGQLTFCKARAITRVATTETEADLVEIARHATGAQLEKLVRSYRSVVTATVAKAESGFAARHLQWSWADDGTLRFEGSLSADEGSLLVQAVEAAMDGRPDETADRPAAAQRADALVGLLRGGGPCELVVHVDAATLGSEEIVSRCEAEAGLSLAPETARRLGCDAAVVGIIERDGVPLSVGRRTRTIPPALRRALRSRDDGCSFPGCTHTRYLHAHHIRHWAHGGPTSLENLVQLCSFHHRLVHEGGYQVVRTGARSVAFMRPDGRRIPTVPSCRGGDGRRLPWVGVDSDTCRPRSAGDRLDYGMAVEGLLAVQGLLGRRGPPAVAQR
jgi:uncharacterized protein DUF222/HNH endonuclease